MRVNLFGILALASSLVMAGTAAVSQPIGSGAGQSAGQSPGQAGQRGRGMGGFPGGGRGVLGAVTEVTPEHYMIKTDGGESYVVHYSVNTRIMKQPAGQGGSAGQTGRRRQGGETGADADAGGERQQPQTIKPTDIKVGDFITAGGEVDAAAKSIGAVFILQIDPERAKQLREMQANYGKTWLAGRVTGIHDTTITIEGIVDHIAHSIEVDENTSFRKRRDSITLADIQTGEQLRAEGALKGGAFLATSVVAMDPPNRGEGGDSDRGHGTGTPQPKPQSAASPQ